MRRRVALAVSPRLLSDTLSRALARHKDIEVVVCDPADVDAGGFDVILVGGTDVEVEMAEPVVVIRLPDADESGIGSVTTERGRQRVPLADVAGVLEVLERLTADG